MLRRHGIPVAHALNGVGENLRDHFTPRPLSYFETMYDALHAEDPDYDGSVTAGSNGLPTLAPLHGYGVLNGGAEIELYRYARHGEQVCTQSRYADIREKQSRKGPMVLVILENDYRTLAGELLLRVKRTYLWSRA